MLHEIPNFLDYFIKKHLIFQAHELLFHQHGVLHVGVLLLLVELLEDKLLAPLLQHLLLRKLCVWNPVMEHVIEIEKVPVQKSDCVSLKTQNLIKVTYIDMKISVLLLCN